MKRLLPLLLCLLSVRAYATTAASTDYADVLAAVTATAPGGTVTVPAGDSTWTSVLAIPKALTITGAGAGQSIIRKATSDMITYSNNITANLSGFTFVNSANSTSARILVLRGLNNIVHDCVFQGTVTKVVAIITSGGTGNPHPTGVIYNCTFIGSRTDTQGDLSSGDPNGFGRRIWADLDSVVAFGSANNIFYEDCTFTLPLGWTGNIMDAEYGGHYVLRYCTLYNGGAFNHGITSNTERGTRMVEIYHNTFIHEPTHPAPQDPPMRFRGGAAVIWSNTVEGTWSTASNLDIMLDNELLRYGNNIGDGNTAVPNGTGTHTGVSGALTLTDATKSWTTNAYVGWTVYDTGAGGGMGTITANTATTVTAVLTGGAWNFWVPDEPYKITNGYPLRDQIGRGKDASFWVWNAPGPVQANQPVYLWDNDHEGGAVAVGTANNGAGWIQAGRDYINNTPLPGYTPYPYPHPLRSGAVAAPVIILNPVTQTVISGSSVTFTASATGAPVPTWQWLKNASPIGGATNVSLILTNVTSADNGSYTATATNSAGSATTAAATLTVNTAPVVTPGTPGTPIITSP